MNQVVLLILTWLPAVISSVVLPVSAKFIVSGIKKALEKPEKQEKELKDLRSDLGRLNKCNNELADLCKKLLEDNESLKLQIKGVIQNGREKIKKN